MKPKIVLSLTLLVMLVLAGSALAYSPRLDGRPAAFEPGGQAGYFIWQDHEGLHLRTTAAGVRHVFSGTIRTDGAYEDTFGKATGVDDTVQVNENRDKITFQFTNSGDTSGIDLHVRGGTYVSFNLAMDGDDVSPAAIFIGAEGWHPGDHKFTLRQDPDPEKYRDDRTIIVIGGPYWWHAPRYWGPGGPGGHGPWRRW
jgi:hypothetical protein